MRWDGESQTPPLSLWATNFPMQISTPNPVHFKRRSAMGQRYTAGITIRIIRLQIHRKLDAFPTSSNKEVGRTQSPLLYNVWNVVRPFSNKWIHYWYYKNPYPVNSTQLSNGWFTKGKKQRQTTQPEHKKLTYYTKGGHITKYLLPVLE